MNSIKALLSAGLVFSSVWAVQASDIQKEKIDSIALNELTVQASRNNTKLQNIPNSVTLLSSHQISTLGLTSLSDASSVIPNLFMLDYGSRLTNPVYIRGIGSKINSPSVGLYVDGVPYFEKSTFNFDFFGISRIEVLRGPQGTQYGRNTMGGIINVLTKSPDNYQGTDIDVQAGTYGFYLLNAAHYAKINSKFAVSLALNYRHNDGFFTNDYLQDKVDNLDSYGLRNRLIYHVSDRLSLENILSFDHLDQGGYPYAVYHADTKTTDKIAYNQYSSYKRKTLSDALVLKYNAQNFDIVSTSSYQYFSDNQSIDQDFSIDSLYFVVQKQKQNMFSEEFIIKSKDDKRYQWQFGAYGFLQQLNTNTDVNVYASKSMTLKTYDHQISGAALFHQSVIRDFPVRNMNLTAGIRLDAERDRLDYVYDYYKNGNTTRMADTVYEPLKSLQVLPKVALDYKLGHTNFYATVAKGYKTGGFNSSFETADDLTFKPEYSWNYEIGVKSKLFANFLYAECSLFYIDWRNQQIYKSYQTSPTTVGQMLKNAGHSQSKGLELSLTTARFSGFEFSANYGYTNATFIEDVLNATTNYNGNYIPNVPKHTLALQGKKTIDLQNNFLNKIVLNVMYKANGPIYWDEANLYKQDYYGLLNARVGFVHKNVNFELWGNNLTGTEYNSYSFSSLGKQFVQLGKPMQLGVRLALNF